MNISTATCNLTTQTGSGLRQTPQCRSAACMSSAD